MEDLSAKQEELVILMAHGSRHREGKRQAEKTMDQVAKLCPHPVEKAYLEILDPDLKACLRKHAPTKNIIFILPLLIFKGGHALRDIPEMVEECREEFPEVEIKVGPVLEPGERLLSFWVDVGLEWLERNAEGNVLLLGRGAKDPEAKVAYENIFSFLETSLNRQLGKAFAGLQEPGLPTAVKFLDTKKPLLVFPCLLFDGVLLERSRSALKFDGVTWAPTLSNSPSLNDEVLALIEDGLGKGLK